MMSWTRWYWNGSRRKWRLTTSLEIYTKGEGGEQGGRGQMEGAEVFGEGDIFTTMPPVTAPVSFDGMFLWFGTI